MRGLLVFFLLSAVAWAQPQLQELLPAQGKAGGLVLIRGQGFGSDKETTQVYFGPTAAKVISIRDDQISAQVPWEAGRESSIKVARDGQESNALPFVCLPSLRLSVAKNPLEVGEKTVGVFQVYHSDEPTTIFLKNGSPEVVRYSAGNTQTLRTSGGNVNQAQFEIEGLVGNKLYDVDYRWGKRNQEEVQWTLPFHKVPWSGK